MKKTKLEEAVEEIFFTEYIPEEESWIKEIEKNQEKLEKIKNPMLLLHK